MGTLEQIRKISPYALGLFAFVFIAFMVASDANISSLIHQGSNYQTAVIAKINGEEIFYKEYEAKVREQTEQQQKSGKADQVIDETQIRRDVWNQMVEEMLMKQEADKAGIFVSKEQIRDIMFENPPEYLKKPFTDTAGNFNKSLYLELITNPDKLSQYISGRGMTADKVQEQVLQFKKDLLLIEKYLRQQMLAQSIMGVVNTSNGVLAPNYVQERYLADNTSIDADFIFFDVNAVPLQSINVTEDDIAKYYDAHKNAYKQKDVRKLKFVRFPLKPSLDDTMRAQKRVDKIMTDLKATDNAKTRDSIFDVKLAEYSGTTTDYTMISDVDKSVIGFLDSLKELQISGPHLTAKGILFLRLDSRRKGTGDVVKASHILINFNGNKDSALKVAQDLVAKAKKGDFAELARQNSQDKGSATQGGDLGWFGKGKMVKEFEEAAFAAPVNQVVGPVESQFGYHIIKVTDKNPEEIKYSMIEINPVLSNPTRNSIFREAFNLQKQVEQGAKFDEIAKKLNLFATETQFFGKHQPVLGSQYLADMSFSSDLNTCFQPMELKNYGIVVAQVVEERKAGIKPLVDVKEDIKRKLIHIKQLDGVKSMAEAAYGKIKTFPTLDLAKAADASLNFHNGAGFKADGTVPGLGVDFVFSTKASTLPIGQISEPFRGTRGYYVVQVKNRQVPSLQNAEGPIYSFRTQLMNQMKQREFYTWFAKIKENAEIEDNRAKYFKEY